MSTVQLSFKLHPGVALRSDRQRTDANARCGEDRVSDGRHCRRQGRFTQTGRIEIGLKELDFDRWWGVPHTRRLVLVKVTLHYAALIDRDFPCHHVTHGLDEPSLHEAGR